jgi:hypothetical protein
MPNLYSIEFTITQQNPNLLYDVSGVKRCLILKHG